MMSWTDMPPRLGMAIGCMTSEPRPVARKTGMSPMTVVAVVMRQGRMRLRPASRTRLRISAMLAGERSRKFCSR